MASYHIDQTDQKILAFLVKNARMPFLEIARECGVSGAAIHQRVKKLESNGVITGSRMVVKPGALGCHFVTGKYAILSKVYCFDNDHLMEILLTTIQKIPYIQSTETMISLDEPIERQVWVKEYKNASKKA